MQIISSKDKVVLYVRSMGKVLKVTAIFTDKDESNAYMEKHRDEGVVAEKQGLILLADMYDMGITIKRGQ